MNADNFCSGIRWRTSSINPTTSSSSKKNMIRPVITRQNWIFFWPQMRPKLLWKRTRLQKSKKTESTWTRKRRKRNAAKLSLSKFKIANALIFTVFLAQLYTHLFYKFSFYIPSPCHTTNFHLSSPETTNSNIFKSYWITLELLLLEMGRRRSRRKPAPKSKLVEPLPQNFPCPFCNHEKSCEG